MTESLPDRGPAAPPHPDPLGVLRMAHGRALEREGIAMFATVDDLRDRGEIVVKDRDSLDEGRRLAELFSHYYSHLEAAQFPNFDPDDEPDHTGARELIDALIILGDRHLQADQEGL